MKKVFIETLGCLKNVNDTQVFSGLLLENGFEIVEDVYEADIMIVNTCGFINDAKVESIDKILELARFSDKLLVVSGCLSKRYAKDLYEEMPEVDIFIGVNEYDKLADILKKAKKGERFVLTEEYTEELETESRVLPEGTYSATIKIGEGCDNRCTYCAIPYIRGPYRSRPMELVIAEAKKLAAAGVKEILLIAQDTAAYGKDLYGRYNLHELLRELCKIDGIKWIRIMYCYEDKITDELIQVMAEEEKICKYVDIPIQHIADNVLKGMARRSTKKSILETIGKLKAAMPDIAIRTTLITGFPGETDEDFDQLYEFVEQTKFARLGAFTYSQEEGTPAATMPNQIDEELKEARKDAIMREQMFISNENNCNMIGKVYEVIIDEKDQDEGVYIGRTQYDAPEIDNQVIIKSDRDHKPGDFINVEIYDAYDYDIVGREID